MALLKNEQRMHWYVMRDLKRPNAKLPAYKQLSDEHLEVFTPMQWRLKLKNGKRIREEVPFMQDLLFIHDTREVLDLFVRKIPTLQYRYQKGGGYCQPMIVSISSDLLSAIKTVIAARVALSIIGCPSSFRRRTRC